MVFSTLVLYLTQDTTLHISHSCTLTLHLLRKPISSLACFINCGTLPRLNKKNTKGEACDQDLGKKVLDVHVNPAKCTTTTTAIHGAVVVAGSVSSLSLSFELVASISL
ncbi:hypothetical protein Hanom_Chr09g00855191 [Helianthus anomalus]